jgi:general secretion pathway protein E
MRRHDPNVILIGEIRDAETAEIAARAAQVGRLVLSTLHTNAASGAVTRLVDLGVPEFLVHNVLRGILGQALQLTPCRASGGAGQTA